MDASKRIVNLSSTYRTFLDKTGALFATAPPSLDTDLKKLDKLHKEIEGVATGLDMQKNEINRLLLHCDNEHPVLHELKNFAVLRNVRLLEKAVKDAKYKEFLGKVAASASNALDKPVPVAQMEKALTTLWNRYLNYWDGYWHSIEYSNGRIKGIEIVDPNEFQELIGILTKKE
jgi:hypothetical protein